MDVFSSRADPVRASLFIAAVKELLAEVCTSSSRLFLPRLAPRLSFFLCRNIISLELFLSKNREPASRCSHIEQTNRTGGETGREVFRPTCRNKGTGDLYRQT